MYESPINIVTTKINTEVEDEIMKAVFHYGIDIDKPSLVKALMYDRDQYDKGYKDGYEAAMRKLNDALEVLGYDPR